MNKECEYTNQGVDREYNLLTEKLSVLASNANADGASHRGWFIGHFLENMCGLRSTSAVEVKWGMYSAGEERSTWGFSEHATTLCVLFKGSVQIIFPQEEHLLSEEGDYILWSAGILHQWKVLEDTSILTIRWPSIPEASKEQRVFSRA